MEDKVKKVNKEYKNVFNFNVEFNNELEELGYYVLKIDGLKMSLQEEYTPLMIELNSPVNPSIEQILVAQFEKKEKFNFSINIIDNNAIVIQKWKIEEAYIEELKFGNYDRCKSDIVNVKVHLFAKTKLDF